MLLDYCWAYGYASWISASFILYVKVRNSVSVLHPAFNQNFRSHTRQPQSEILV